MIHTQIMTQVSPPQPLESVRARVHALIRLQDWALLSHDQKGEELDSLRVLGIGFSIIQDQGIMIQQGSTVEPPLWATHSSKPLPHDLKAPTYILKLQD